MKKFIYKLILLITISLPNISFGQLPFITVASTTSTENSGLFSHLIPLFTLQSGIDVKVISQGTGQAIKTAENGDADVLFVHHTPSEIEFVNKGFGEKRYNVMRNDFVIIGPPSDPAKLLKIQPGDIFIGFRKIAQYKATFISRGDDSGTHKKELEFWKTSSVISKEDDWYFQSGSSMGATINMAITKNAYTMTDRATWLAFQNKADFKIVLQGDPKLLNQYGIIAVKHHNLTKGEMAQKFVDWIISPAGQNAINQFKIDGKQVFFANYK